jgi:putative tryptophan/tyrosine transport system substrate-binding protein
MRRREFIAGLGSAAVWPMAAGAQQRTMPVIGYLASESLNDQYRAILAAFNRGLADAGYVDGRNVAFEYRWAESDIDRLPALALELVQRRVDLIVTVGTPATFAAKAATTTIPILFFQGADPVKIGLVASLARPGGNVTGIANLASGLTAKRIQLLHQLVPTATSIAMLANVANVVTPALVAEGQVAARALGINLLIINARSQDEIGAAFTAIVEQRAGALLINADSLFITQVGQLVALTAQNGIPASHEFRLFPAAGGLMSYGTDLLDAHRQLGLYASRILKGDKPADLPVQQPVKFEMVLNLKTAKALGLIISDLLLTTADEVIQ